MQGRCSEVCAAYGIDYPPEIQSFVDAVVKMGYADPNKFVRKRPLSERLSLGPEASTSTARIKSSRPVATPKSRAVVPVIEVSHKRMLQNSPSRVESSSKRARSNKEIEDDPEEDAEEEEDAEAEETAETAKKVVVPPEPPVGYHYPKEARLSHEGKSFPEFTKVSPDDVLRSLLWVRNRSFFEVARSDSRDAALRLVQRTRWCLYGCVDPFRQQQGGFANRLYSLQEGSPKVLLSIRRLGYRRLAEGDARSGPPESGDERKSDKILGGCEGEPETFSRGADRGLSYPVLDFRNLGFVESGAGRGGNVDSRASESLPRGP